MQVHRSKDWSELPLALILAAILIFSFLAESDEKSECLARMDVSCFADAVTVQPATESKPVDRMARR
jgi:hypothetical protein